MNDDPTCYHFVQHSTIVSVLKTSITPASLVSRPLYCQAKPLGTINCISGRYRVRGKNGSNCWEGMVCSLSPSKDLYGVGPCEGALSATHEITRHPLLTCWHKCDHSICRRLLHNVLMTPFVRSAFPPSSSSTTCRFLLTHAISSTLSAAEGK